MSNTINITEKASIVVSELKTKYGKLIFHQSGGCCDGSAPMCFKEGELLITEQDILWGHVLDCPFYISKFQYDLWKHTVVMLDAVKGRGASFSLEIPMGVRFVIRSSVCMVKMEL